MEDDEDVKNPEWFEGPEITLQVPMTAAQQIRIEALNQATYHIHSGLGFVANVTQFEQLTEKFERYIRTGNWVEE